MDAVCSASRRCPASDPDHPAAIDPTGEPAPLSTPGVPRSNARPASSGSRTFLFRVDVTVRGGLAGGLTVEDLEDFGQGHRALPGDEAGRVEPHSEGDVSTWPGYPEPSRGSTVPRRRPKGLGRPNCQRAGSGCRCRCRSAARRSTPTVTAGLARTWPRDEPRRDPRQPASSRSPCPLGEPAVAQVRGCPADASGGRGEREPAQGQGPIDAPEREAEACPPGPGKIRRARHEALTGADRGARLQPADPSERGQLRERVTEPGLGEDRGKWLPWAGSVGRRGVERSAGRAVGRRHLLVGPALHPRARGAAPPVHARRLAAPGVAGRRRAVRDLPRAGCREPPGARRGQQVGERSGVDRIGHRPRGDRADNRRRNGHALARSSANGGGTRQAERCVAPSPRSVLVVV